MTAESASTAAALALIGGAGYRRPQISFQEGTMMTSMTAAWVRGACAVAVLASGAAAMSCSGGLGGILISNQQEVEIGAGVDEQIRLEYALAEPSDPITQWAAEIVAQLQAGSAGFRDPAEIGGYKVAVIVDDGLVNAFAAPGGYTYISTGLILNASSCAEIAGVMGHELAHVTERHGVEAVEGAIAAGLLTDIFLGEGLAADAAATIWSVLQGTTFSREKEAEADEVGLQITYNGGYNPYGLVDFFEALLALQSGAEPPEFLSSHPATSSRITEVTDRIEKLYGAHVVRGETQTYGCQASLSLEQAQARVQSGQIAIIPGTGTQPPQ